ncbi:hypothetical protein [Mycobacterium uberis]|uniref:hypothetical protein n=1 Tax=Mycobacterium uberis TaxID=2162698 RepID=UPI000E305E45|nr:hypothetical protein [Mycobacterium uberis]
MLSGVLAFASAPITALAPPTMVLMVGASTLPLVGPGSFGYLCSVGPPGFELGASISIDASISTQREVPAPGTVAAETAVVRSWVRWRIQPAAWL